MAIIFTCENCGKRFNVDERSQGRRGRCSVCRHVMRIPGAAVAERVHASAPAPEPAADLPFKLSPPEPHPMAHQVVLPATTEPAPAHPVEPHHSIFALRLAAPHADQPHANEPHAQFELLDDDTDPASGVAVSPEIARGLQEVAEFEKDPQGLPDRGRTKRRVLFPGAARGRPRGLGLHEMAGRRQLRAQAVPLGRHAGLISSRSRSSS